MQQHVLNVQDRDREGLIELLVKQNVKVHYQAIVNPFDGQVVSLEALSRLHGFGEPALPSAFIERYVSAGIASNLDMHVIKNVAKHIFDWKHTIPVNINFSLAQFEDSRIAERMGQIHSVYRIKPEQIKIEVTEAQKITKLSCVAKKLESLKLRGYRIALDDFGSGYSTLKMLKEFPFVDDVKLDRYYISSPFGDKEKKMVAHFGEFIKKMGLNYIVEGVETHEQLEFLRSIGVDGVQGFLIHRPQQLNHIDDLKINSSLAQLTKVM
jgi:EAL domain-containing protein (putative c-di-GMP-specific phosphodiesterase class I)